MGSNAGVFKGFIIPPPRSQATLEAERTYPFFAATTSGQCVVDGIETPCSLAAGEAAVQCPNNDCGGWNWNQKGGRGAYQVFRAFADGRAGYMPVDAFYQGHGYWITPDGYDAEDGGELEPSEDEFFGHQRNPQESNVKKTYPAKFRCNISATEVMEEIRKDFSKFGNLSSFLSTWYLPGRVEVLFGSGPVTQGQSISINSRIWVIHAIKPDSWVSTSVTVSEVDSQNFTFTTVPGHVLYPATISFGASDLLDNKIAFSIRVDGNFAGRFEEIGYKYLGGRDLEDDIWNNYANQ